MRDRVKEESKSVMLAFPEVDTRLGLVTMIDDKRVAIPIKSYDVTAIINDSIAILTLK